MYFRYDASGLYTSSEFRKGGFLNKYEYEITQINGSSYLAPGIEYWTMTDYESNSDQAYFIGNALKYKNKSGVSRVRITEYVKPETKVRGLGTSTNPWVFVDTNAVIVVSNNGQYGKINGQDSITAIVDKSRTSLEITLEPATGYRYTGVSEGCTISLKSGNVYKILNITSDISCRVIFDRGTYTYELAGPYTTAPDPERLYYVYNDKWYLDSGKENIITQLSTKPTKTGYTFSGYYTEDNVSVINSSGVISTTYKPTDNIVNKTLVPKWTARSFTCSAGTYLPQNSIECSECKVGSYCTGGTYTFNETTDQGLTACPSGMTSEVGASAKTGCKVTCAAGTYLAANGTSCVACPANSYCEGKTCNFSTSSDCGKAACPSGMTSAASSTAKTSCKLTCEAGTYLKANGTSCVACPVGSYCGEKTCNFSTTDDCGKTLCPSGMTSAESSTTKTNCKITCEAGTYLAKNGTSCIACTAGNYCEGKTCNYSTTDDCGKTSCPSGMTSAASSTAKTNCKITCEAGTYLAKNATSCVACPANSYCEGKTCNFSTSSDCGKTACPSGMTSNASSTAKTSCSITCAAGTYLAANGTSCVACPAGSYCGGKTCNFSTTDDCGKTACPGSMTSAAGSTVKTNCKITCASGTYLKSNGTSCVSCAANNYCAGKTCNFNTSSNCGITACPTGYSNSTGQSAKSSCQITCAANTRVASADAQCTSCSSGYVSSSHTVNAGSTSSCTLNKVTVRINGALGEKISWSGTESGSTTLDNTGQKSVSLTPGSYTFTSGYAFNSDFSTKYSHAYTITSSTTTINHLPGGAIYWFGNGSVANSSLAGKCGGAAWSYTDVNGTQSGNFTSITSNDHCKNNKNYMTAAMTSSGGAYQATIGCNKAISKGSYTRMRALVKTTDGANFDNSSTGLYLHRQYTYNNGTNWTDFTGKKYVNIDISSFSGTLKFKGRVRTKGGGSQAVDIYAIWLA